MGLNLTTQIVSVHSNRLTAFSNYCLRPAAYLFEGRKVTLYRGEVVHLDRAFPEKSWMKTAFAIAAFIPATILGAISRLIEWLHADLRQGHHAVSITKGPIVVTDDMSLTKAFKIVYKKGEALTYKDPAKISEYMCDAAKQMDILYRELRIEATNEAAALQQKLGPVALDTIDTLFDPEHANAKTLAAIEQKIKEAHYPVVLKHYEEKKWFFREIAPDAFSYYEFLKKCKGDKTKLIEVMMANILKDQLKPYCEKYFYNALTTVYHKVRINMAPTDEWRATYNRFCEQFNQIKEFMTDGRFANWSEPDVTGEILKDYPDTQPTLFPKFYD